MACQGTPTATQFTTVVQTSFPERTIVTTELVTAANAGFRRVRRQDPNASADVNATVDTSPTDTTTTTTDIFNVDEVSTDIRTVTITDTVLVTNTIPQATLYAPCSTTHSTTPSPTTDTNTNTNTGTASVTSPPSASAIIGASNSTATGLPPQNVVSDDGKTTTTSGSLTLVFSEIITTVNGVRTTTATPIQTILNTSDGGPLSDSQRTGVIAGSVGGALVILLALLALVFFIRRRRQTQDRTRMMEEKARRPPRHLLEAEADDDMDESFAPPMSKWDALSLTTGSGSVVSAPRLLRARGSNTGSLFHENVWPPPSEVMQDPLLTANDLGSSISLVTGIPIDTSEEPQQRSNSNSPSRPNSGYMPTAISTGEAVGAVGRQQRSSAYDSVRSMDSVDYYNYNRSHSRAESVEPLLDSAGPAGRTISPPPLSLRNTAGSPPPPSFRPGRTNMRISYTAPGLSHARTGTVGSSYSANSMSPGSDSLPGSADTGNSELLRDVLSAGSRAETPQEIPPMYHTIRRDIP